MPAWQIAEAQMADANADELFHIVPDFVKHPANLAVDPLAQDDVESSGLNGLDLRDPRALAIEHDAAQ